MVGRATLNRGEGHFKQGEEPAGFAHFLGKLAWWLVGQLQTRKKGTSSRGGAPEGVRFRV